MKLFQNKFLLRRGGSFYDLEQLTIEHKINIDFNEIVKTFPKYCSKLTHSGKDIFRSFYQKRMTVTEIAFSSPHFINEEEVIEVLENTTRKYVELLKLDYGLK